MKKTTVEIDEKKLEIAMSLSPVKSLKQLIGAALDAYIQRQERLSFKDLVGSEFWSGDIRLPDSNHCRGSRYRLMDY